MSRLNYVLHLRIVREGNRFSIVIFDSISFITFEFKSALYEIGARSFGSYQFVLLPQLNFQERVLCVPASRLSHAYSNPDQDWVESNGKYSGIVHP
jgi:hypothetical protein